MKHKPMTKQRSAWDLIETMDMMGAPAKLYRRAVGDGWLSAIVANEPGVGLHLSISHRLAGNGHGNRQGRYPRWDEIMDARLRLLPDSIGFVMHLPPMNEYVALHDTTFHLHQHPAPTEAT